MKWSFVTLGVIVLGVIGVSIILLFQQLTTSSENDYYLLKEITEAAMIDAIDIPYYRDTGSLKIVKEKFVENFTRRFAESTLFAGVGYKINFYNIMETPPEVTVLIDTDIGQYRVYKDISNYNVQNNLTGILEYIGASTDSNLSNENYVPKTYDDVYYSMPNPSGNEFIVKEPINIPDELDQEHIKNVQITDIQVLGVVKEQGELLKAKLKREVDWAKAEENRNTDYSANAISIQSFFTGNFTPSTIDYYNCSTRTGNSTRNLDGVECNKYSNWVYWKGTNASGNTKPIALKLKIYWSYEEYEYSS